MSKDLQMFYRIKRLEYEYAVANKKPALAEVIRQCVKKSLKLNNLKPVPGEQQTLF